MTPTAAMAAARILNGAWRKGEHVETLPESCRPASRADGYAIQAQWAEEVGDRIAGWKIAATSEAGQRHIAVSGPIAGPIFAHRVHGDGAEIALANVGMRVAECEVVFRFREPLRPRGSTYPRSDVIAAVGEVLPGIEVPDSRFVRFERAGEAQLIADCACMNEMIVGEASAVDLRIDGLARLQLRAELSRSGRAASSHVGIGANALGDPVTALLWLVNELTGQGRTIEAGHFVTTGTCVTPIPVDAGDSLAVDYGWLGRLGARFR